IRYLLSSVPYRKGLNFTMEGLKSATTAIERLRNLKFRLETAMLPAGEIPALTAAGAKAMGAFRAALDDDLNTAEALAAIFEFVREANTALDHGEFLELNRESAVAVLNGFDAFFDVLRPTAPAGGLSDDDVEKLEADRIAAKKSRDFALSDRIRAH